MNSLIRRLVLDVLKPYEPEITIVARMLLEKTEKSIIDGCNITVSEMDRLTQKVKITIQGKSLDYEEINDILISMNCIVHSVDQVAAGEQIVEDIDTPQDPF
jgi:hypothetical protein